MLNNLISGYRVQFYDWTWESFRAFLDENKGISISFCIFVLLSIGIIIFAIIVGSVIFSFVFMLLEVIFGICMDRFIVKQYQVFITRKQQHLISVITFLETVVPNCNLYNSGQIDSVIQRLTKHIDSKKPFQSFMTGFVSFGKAIVFPSITYIAGVYSNNVAEIGFPVILTWTITGIVILGVITVILGATSKMLQSVICRDYDAAVALREDLLDIKLLFLGKSDGVENNKMPMSCNCT